jgi:hypothetical protein
LKKKLRLRPTVVNHLVEERVAASQRDRLGVRVSGIEVPQAGVAAFRSTVTTAVAAVTDGRLRPLVGMIAPLEKAADVHRAIEAREAVGTSVLVVEH